jgi:protein-tyrosine phosphatase
MTSTFWIQHTGSVKLAIVARPRGGGWLEEDLAKLKRDGIDILVSLLTAPEAEELGLGKEQEIAEALGLQFAPYPIPDRTTPSNLKSFRQFIARLVTAIQSGKSVGAHCRGCIGRATVTTAAILIELGFSADDALALIEQARGCMVPDTAEQLEWIRAYALKGSMS